MWSYSPTRARALFRTSSDKTASNPDGPAPKREPKIRRVPIPKLEFELELAVFELPEARKYG